MGRKARAKAIGLTQQGVQNPGSKFGGASTASNPDHESKYSKDAEELGLEKLVFGDDVGFQAALGLEDRGKEEISDALGDDTAGIDSENGTEIQSDIEEIADEDQSPIAPKSSKNLDENQGENPPAWIDSEDERIVVSLASDTRLRKLRISEEEDLVDGKEYIRRLQQQFERLYPRPEWAKASDGHTHRKKRRRTSESGSSEDGEDSDAMSMDLDNLSSQPLSKLLQSTDTLIQAPDTNQTSRKLRPDNLDIQRTKDVGGIQPSAITSLIFHPSHPILLSTGLSALATLHHLSPASTPSNPTLHTLHIRKFPIHAAAVHPSGDAIYLASRRRYFMIWSLATGKIQRVTRINTPSSATPGASDQRSCERFKLSPCGRYMALVGTAKKGGGVVNILDANTTQWICQARVEGRNGVAEIAWWSDGEGLLIVGKGGDAIEYCVRTRSVVARWQDQGAVGITTIALGGRLPAPSMSSKKKGKGKLADVEYPLGPNRWVALGSQSGIVTLYDRSGWGSSSPKGDNDSDDSLSVPAHPTPKKTLEHLTTPTSHLLFAEDGQMLVMASRWKKDALRLVHIPSFTVYSRWPASGTPLGRISAVALSKDGGKLVVGNEAGKVRMWDIRG